MEFFLYNKHKIAVKRTIHENSAVSKPLLVPENYSVPHRHRLGQTLQPLSYFKPQKPL